MITESGSDAATISVLRKCPRKSRSTRMTSTAPTSIARVTLESESWIRCVWS